VLKAERRLEPCFHDCRAGGVWFLPVWEKVYMKRESSWKEKKSSATEPCVGGKSLLQCQSFHWGQEGGGSGGGDSSQYPGKAGTHG